MAYLNHVAQELYLFAWIKTLSCSTCDSWMYLPGDAMPIVKCYCYTTYRDVRYSRYAKYENYRWK